MKNLNEKILFWASFMTLIAAGMGFSIRGDILADWGRQFHFTQTDLGIITGQGLAGFGFTIIFFSFFSDILGYAKLMVIAFLFHGRCLAVSYHQTNAPSATTATTMPTPIPAETTNSFLQ